MAPQVNNEHTIKIRPAVDGVETIASGDGVSFALATRMQIAFRDLKYSVKVKATKGQSANPLAKAQYTDKTIIRNVSGLIQPGRMTAVMGASGAGKTTFLNVVAGFRQPNTRVEGTISINNKPISGSHMQEISGFVHQEDVILDTMTVREALVFAAVLKLPKHIPKAQKVERALKVADLLNLTKSLDHVVGSALFKGISGGEKRRLSLGMEMITNPSILFLDEPTSGLDTYTAFKVMRILNNVSHSQGRTVVATVHQPSSDIFHLFDDLLVLAEGQVLYMGEVENMVVHFDHLGYKCPQYTNPADFLFMEVLYLGKKEEASAYNLVAVGHMQDTTTATEYDGEKARLANEQRVRQLLEAWPKSEAYAQLEARMSDNQLVQGGVRESDVQANAGFKTQFQMLAWRASVNQWRNKLMLQAKVGQTLFLSLIVGLVYLNVGTDYKSVQDRQGSLFFLAVQSLFGSVMGTLTVFGAEKTVFLREYSSRMYGLPGYFISRFVVEMPLHIIFPFIMACITYWMVGYQAVAAKFLWYSLTLILMDSCGAAIGMFVSCLFNSIEVALTVMPLVLLPLMVFSGFFINTDSIPPYFVWISYLSPIRYGFAAIGLNEFTDLELHCRPSDPCQPGFSGDDVVKSLNFQGSVESNNGILFGYMWAAVLLAYLALWGNLRRARK